VHGIQSQHGAGSTPSGCFSAKLVIWEEMTPPISSDHVHAEIDKLLLSGRAKTASEAEAMFLDAHLPDLTKLALELNEEDFSRHEAVKLLFAHGSRRWEDAMK